MLLPINNYGNGQYVLDEDTLQVYDKNNLSRPLPIRIYNGCSTVRLKGYKNNITISHLVADAFKMPKPKPIHY